MAVGFLVTAAGAQPAAAGAQALQQTAAQTLPTTLTAPDPYQREATTFLTRGGQQIAVRPLRATLTASGARVVADRILVKFNEPVTINDLANSQAKAAGAGAGAATALVRIGASSFMIDVTGSASIEAAAQAYKSADPRVVGAGPDYMMHSDETPNDADFGKQTDMAVIQAPLAWNRTHGSSSKVIAVLDSGLNDIGPDANPEFAGKVLDHRDFTGSASGTDDFLGHGTHVAGIAAAATNNALGIAGSGYDSRLLVAKVLDDTGSGPMSQLTDADDECIEVSAGGVRSGPAGARRTVVHVAGTRASPPLCCAQPS
jgi:Subtilase family